MKQILKLSTAFLVLLVLVFAAGCPASQDSADSGGSDNADTETSAAMPDEQGMGDQTADSTEVETEPEVQLAAAPNVSFKDAEGNVKSLSDFQGKPLVVNFWAVW